MIVPWARSSARASRRVRRRLSSPNAQTTYWKQKAILKSVRL